MRILILFLIIVISCVASAKKSLSKPKIPPGSLAIFIDNSYQIVKFKKKSDLLLSESCVDNCLAVLALSKKNAFPKARHAAMQNPAALYCASVGGANMIGINEKGGEENVCKFTDNSYVNSWDLFYHRFPK